MLVSLRNLKGIVRVVFATVALGMRIELKDVNTVTHYGLLEVWKIIFKRVDKEDEVIVMLNPLCIECHEIVMSKHSHPLNMTRKLLM